MLTAYHTRQVGSLRYEKKTYARDLSVLQDYLRLCGTAGTRPRVPEVRDA